MQSDLLGAYALGIRNLLCLSGDHQTFGNHPNSKNVYDLDSVQMIQMVAEMRDKHVFQCGDPIKGVEPRFFVGAAPPPLPVRSNTALTGLRKKFRQERISSRPN